MYDLRGSARRAPRFGSGIQNPIFWWKHENRRRGERQTRFYCATYGRHPGAAPTGPPHFGGNWEPFDIIFDTTLLGQRNTLLHMC